MELMKLVLLTLLSCVVKLVDSSSLSLKQCGITKITNHLHPLYRPRPVQCTMSRVLLAGASGETGKVVLAKLLEDDRVSKVTTLVRRTLTVEHEKLNQAVVNYDELDPEIFSDHDVGISCLGTTRGKAGAKGFYKVDHDYNMAVAENCKKAGCSQFHLISSAGANKDSMFLYPQTKGITDDKVLNMGFERAVIYRPGLIMVEREEKRTGEAIARWIAGWVDKGNSWSAKVEDIGLAMATNQFTEDTCTILENADIVNYAKNYAKDQVATERVDPVVAAEPLIAAEPVVAAEPVTAAEPVETPKPVQPEGAPVTEIAPEKALEAEADPELKPETAPERADVAPEDAPATVAPQAT